MTNHINNEITRELRSMRTCVDLENRGKVKIKDNIINRQKPKYLW